MHILQKNTHTCNENINLATKKFPRVFSKKKFQEFSWKDVERRIKMHYNI